MYLERRGGQVRVSADGVPDSIRFCPWCGHDYRIEGRPSMPAYVVQLTEAQEALLFELAEDEREGKVYAYPRRKGRVFERLRDLGMVELREEEPYSGRSLWRLTADGRARTSRA